MDNESSMSLGKTLAIVVPLLVGGIIFIVVIMAGMSNVGGVGLRPFSHSMVVAIIALVLANVIGWAIRWVMPDDWKA